MNIGIVGGGMVAIAHIRALQELKSISNIFIYTRKRTQAEELAKQFNKVHPAESLKAMVKNSKGVIIATPNNTHLSILQDIITIKPIPVLCEKPLTSTLSDAKEFLKLAHPLSVIGFNYRFNKAVLFIIALIQRKNLDDILQIDLAINRNSALTKKTMTWRDDQAQKGSSGAFGDLGCHLLDLIGYISGSRIAKDSLRVSKKLRVPVREGIALTEEDHCIIVGATETQVFFKIQASKSAEDSQLGFHMHVTSRKGEIHYSSQFPDRVIFKSYDHISIEEIRLNVSQLIENPKTETAYWSDSFYLQDQLWVDQIRAGRLTEPLADIQAGVEIQELISGKIH